MNNPSIRLGKLSSATGRISGPKGRRKGRAKNKNIDRIWRLAMRMAYLLYLAFGFAFRPRHRGAGVALWHAGELLMVKNTYRRRWGVPAGSVRRSESPRAAAVRELKEEVGIELPADRLEPVGIFCDTNEFFRDRFTLFAVEMDRRPVVRPDHREVARARFMPPSQALALALQPPIRTYLEGRDTGVKPKG